VNMTGISGPETVGMLVTDPDPPAIRLPSFFSSSVLPDTLALRLSTECSKIAVQKFPAAGAQSTDVVEVRDALDAISDMLAKKAALELRRQVLLKLNEQWDAAKGDPTKTDDLKRTGAILFPGMKLESADAVAETLDALGDDTRGAIGQLASSIMDKKDEQIRLRSKYGLIVTQWTVAKQKGFWGSLGEIIGIDSSSSSNHGGVLVIADLRVASLIVGDDFWWRLRQFRDRSRTGADAVFDGYVVTHQLAAARWAYSEQVDFSRYLSASLDVTKVKSVLGGG